MQKFMLYIILTFKNKMAFVYSLPCIILQKKQQQYQFEIPIWVDVMFPLGWLWDLTTVWEQIEQYRL